MISAVRLAAFVGAMAAMLPIAAFTDPASAGQTAPLPAASAETVPAPFGLSWGMSRDQVRALGADLLGENDGGCGTEAIVTALPKLLVDAESALLCFGYDDRLWRVSSASRDIEDPTGWRAMARYRELSGLLTELYGVGTAIDREPQGLFAQREGDFVRTLRSGERHHVTWWAVPGMSVELSLRASDGGNAYWILVYEHADLGAAFRAARAAREKGAL